MLPLLFSRLLQSSPFKVEQKVLLLLGQGIMMIMIEWGFSSCFFSPLSNLGYLHCRPDSVESWICLGAEAHATEMDVPIETNLIFE